MKALPLMVFKLWPMLTFFKSRSNFKVKVTRSTRVSGETGALLVYSCLITYKRFSQRYQVNMMIYKGVIMNKSSSSYRLNVCSLNVSDGNYLKTVKDTQNLRPQYRKPSRRGFQIIPYMFNLNVNLPLANQICCTHYMCIIT